MSIKMKIAPQVELAGKVDIKLGGAQHPHYGRYLEDFEPGQVFAHPRGLTIERARARDFATTFMQANPLYLNDEFAKQHGYAKSPVCPQMVFNVVLSLGVQNDSEKAIANLGYYQAAFLRPVLPGDTLTAMTRVIDRKDRGADKPGIATIQTIGLNQHGQPVLQYERKILVSHRGDRPATRPANLFKGEFPWQENPIAEFPQPTGPWPTHLTGQETYAEDFVPSAIVVHPNGRTITSEHVVWTYGVGNTHPLHYDRIYSTGLSGAMSGEPIVYGGLIFSWLDGMAGRDLSENALWDIGFTEGYHTQPTFEGDTVYALSRVLNVAPGPEGVKAKEVSIQFIGVKNISAKAALEQYGADLFIKENDKKDLGKEKIKEKIFEIERRLLIKSRA